MILFYIINEKFLQDNTSWTISQGSENVSENINGVNDKNAHESCYNSLEVDSSFWKVSEFSDFSFQQRQSFIVVLRHFSQSLKIIDLQIVYKFFSGYRCMKTQLVNSLETQKLTLDKTLWSHNVSIIT